MKATFQIPDELYREVKSETAKDGRTVREVTISLFEQWLRQEKQPSPHATAIDWENFQAPLSHLVPAEMTDHSTEAMRKSNPKSTTIKNHLYIIKASYPEAPQSGA